MTLGLFLPLIRAAARAHVLGVVDVDASVQATAAAGVYTRTAGSWIDDGFAAGQEVTVSGLADAGNGLVTVKSVAALTLTTTGTGTGAGQGRFLVALPAEIAWEGRLYAPQGRPFVAEVVQPVLTERRGAAPGGVIQHRVLAAYTLHYPRGGGEPLAIERMAGAVLERFRPGTTLQRTAGGASISARVVEVSASPLYLDGDWMSRAVSATLQGHTVGD